MARQYAEPGDRPPPAPPAPATSPASTGPIEPRTGGGDVSADAGGQFGRAEEDRLDALENASATPAERRKRDLLFLFIQLLLTALLVAGIVLVLHHRR